MADYFGVAAPPQAPAIEGVLTGISVTNEGLSEVGLLELHMVAGLSPHMLGSVLKHYPHQTVALTTTRP